MCRARTRGLSRLSSEQPSGYVPMVAFDYDAVVDSDRRRDVTSREPVYVPTYGRNRHGSLVWPQRSTAHRRADRVVGDICPARDPSYAPGGSRGNTINRRCDR